MQIPASLRRTNEGTELEMKHVRVGSSLSLGSIHPRRWTDDRALLLVAALGTVLRLWFIWAGWCDHYIIADDAYYYFTIARNIVHGAGSTFDGIAPTNGYHPLYLITLIPLFWITSAISADAWLPVHGALTLCTACDLASGLILYTTMVRVGFIREARWASAFWFLSPFSVLLSLRGLEGSLNVLLVAAWLHLASCVYASRLKSVRRVVGLGLVHGIAILARTDNAVLLTVTLVLLGLIAVRRRRTTAWHLVGFLAQIGTISALVVLPWVDWNILTFGTPFQVSALAKLTNEQLYGHLGALHGLAGLIAMAVSLGAFLWQPVMYVAGEEFGTWRLSLILGWIVLFVLILCLPIVRRELRRPRGSASPFLLEASLIFLTCHAVFYAFVLRSYSIWYASVPSYLLSLLTGVGLGAIIVEQPHMIRRAAGALSAVAAGMVFALFFSRTGILQKGPSRKLAPIFGTISAHSPRVRFIGAFNAGRPGYFASTFGPFAVINLDCLVNNAAFMAWRRGAYPTYIAQHVDLLMVDNPANLRMWMTEAELTPLLSLYPKWPHAGLYGPRTASSLRPVPHPRSFH